MPPSSDVVHRGAAEQVFETLREDIIEGRLGPGTRLSEDALAATLDVSRNTLREAFRLLTHERLVVHELHRGVFVRHLGRQDIVDLFGYRRILELAAVNARDHHTRDRLDALGDAVAVGRRAAAAHDWIAAGTANMRFHQAITSLYGNDHLDDAMGRVLAELRLAFHRRPPAEAHGPYVEWNRSIYRLLAAGNTTEAASELARYLDRAESELLEDYAIHAQESLERVRR